MNKGCNLNNTVIYYDIPKSYEDEFRNLLIFYGLRGVPYDDFNDGTREYFFNHIFFCGNVNRDKSFWKVISYKFQRIIDLSGSYSNYKYVNASRCYLSSRTRIHFDTNIFLHRMKKEESVTTRGLSVNVFETNDHVLINRYDNITPFLLYKEDENGEAIYSTVDFFSRNQQFSLFSLDYVDIFWRSVEILYKEKLLHHRWSESLCIRFDDVIGDCPFDFLQSLGNLAQYALIAADLFDLRKHTFENYIRECGELCIHAYSHYKYINREDTVLLYMEWDKSAEYTDNKLKAFFKHYDQFFSYIPSEKKSRVLSTHGFQVGKKSISYLLERGVNFIISPFYIGEAFTSDTHHGYKSFPYNNPNYQFTEIPEGLKLFFCNRIKKRHINCLKFRNYRLSEVESSSIDLLYNLKMFIPPNIYRKPVRQIIYRIEKLRAMSSIVGFPFVIFTHESAINYLGKEAWEEVVKYINTDLLPKYTPRRLSDVLTEMDRVFYAGGSI